MKDRTKDTTFHLVLLLCTVIPLFALGLSNHGLWTADEPRVAEIGREMGLSGNWAVPTLNEKPFLEEPPLYYGALAGTFRILGVSDSVARLPSALFGLAGVVALFFLGRMLFGPRVGLLSGLIMATCGEYFRVAHWVIVDSALACFVTVAVTLFVAAYLSADKGRRLLFYGLCYISATLAFFVKGFIGVVFPGLAVLAFLVFHRNMKEVLRMHLWLGFVIFAALVLPWFAALWQQGGTHYLEVFLVHNHLGRFAGGSSGHHQPFYYYLTQFPAAFLPWSILIVPVFYRAFRRVGFSEVREETGLLLGKCWFIAGFLFLSIASTKRVLYLMPIFPPVCLMTAWYIDRILKGMRLARFEQVFLRLFVAVPLGAAVAVVLFYFTLGPKQGLSFSWMTAMGIVVFSAAAGVLAAAALKVFTPLLVRFWALSFASIYALLLLGLIVVIPVLDRYKSFVPFCHDIESVVPAGATLYAYKPDETLRGAVPFYTGHFLKEIDQIGPLDQAVQRGTIFVVIRDKRKELERDFERSGCFSVVSRQGMDSDRSLVIFKSRGECPGGRDGPGR